jgi:hypothetical protein
LTQNPSTPQTGTRSRMRSFRPLTAIAVSLAFTSADGLTRKSSR